MVLKSHDVMDSDYIYRLHYAKFLSSRLTNFVPFSKKNQANIKVGLFNFQQKIIPTQKIIGIDYIVLNSHKINTNIKRRIFSLRNNKSKINNSKYENYPNFHIKSKITSLPSTVFKKGSSKDTHRLKGLINVNLEKNNFHYNSYFDNYSNWLIKNNTKDFISKTGHILPAKDWVLRYIDQESFGILDYLGNKEQELEILLVTLLKQYQIDSIIQKFNPY